MTSFERLLLQNVVLKAERDRLQRFASECQLRNNTNDGDDDDSKQQQQHQRTRMQQRERRATVIRDTFDKYDTDNSGYIDRGELAHAAMMLDEVLDDDELESAFSELDIDHDGRVSFDEFSRWWLAPDREVKDKTLMKVAAIKTKLTSQMFADGVPSLIRKLSEHSADDSADIRHSLVFSVGDVSQPRAKVKLAPIFQQGAPPAVFERFPASNVAFTLHFRVDEAQTSAQREASRKDIMAALKEAPKPVDCYVDVDDPAHTHMSIGVPAAEAADAFAALSACGVNMNDFVHDTFIELSLGVALTDLVNTDDPPPGSLAEHLAFQYTVQVQYRKALVAALVALADTPAKWQQLGGLLAFSWLHESEVRLQFGGVHDFIAGMKEYMQAGNLMQMLQESHKMTLRQLAAVNAAPAVMAAVKQKQAAEVAALHAKEEGGELPFYMNLNWYTKNRGYQHELKRQYNGVWGVMVKSLPASVAPLVLSLQEHFVEFTGVTFVTKSGVGFELTCDNIFPLALLPAFTQHPDTKRLQLA